MPASAPLALLIRDGSHAGATTRLALKVEQLSIALTKTPIQIPIARSTPEILDLGITRPAITVSGLVDNVGQDATNVTTNQYFHMEKMTLSGPDAAGTGTENQDYYIPYKNFLEHKLVTWISSASTDLQIEVGDATIPDWPGTGTIAEALDNIEKDIDVTPATNNLVVGYTIIIGTEQMVIESISGDTITVVERGANGTTVAVASDGATYSVLDASTGGGIYKVAIQQVQFSQTPGTEDRWVFNAQFVAKLREGITFS